MIPTTLPPPAAPAAVERAGARSAPGDDDFDRALAGATGPTGAPAPAGDRPVRETTGERPDRSDGPGPEGSEQALAALPADAPGRVVVSGDAPDARPAHRLDATPVAAPAADPTTGEAAPGADPATGEAAPAVPDASAPADGVGPEAPAPAGGDPASTAAEPLAGDTGPQVPGDAATEVATEERPDPETVRRVGPDRAGDVERRPGDEAADGMGTQTSRDGAAAAQGTGRPDTDADTTVPRGAERTTGPGPAPAAPGRPVADEHAARPAAPPPDVAPHPAGVAAAGAPPASAPAAAVSSAAPAAPGGAPPVVDQLVAHVSPLAGAAEGTHELTLELRPAELGAVRLEVTLDDGVLSVRVHADDPASRRLLAQSLGDLRHALADAGISAGSLDVGDPHAGAEARGRDGDRSSPGRGGDRPPAADDAPRPARGRASSTSAVDVLL